MAETQDPPADGFVTMADYIPLLVDDDQLGDSKTIRPLKASRSAKKIEKWQKFKEGKKEKRREHAKLAQSGIIPARMTPQPAPHTGLLSEVDAVKEQELCAKMNAVISQARAAVAAGLPPPPSPILSYRRGNTTTITKQMQPVQPDSSLSSGVKKGAKRSVPRSIAMQRPARDWLCRFTMVEKSSQWRNLRR